MSEPITFRLNEVRYAMKELAHALESLTHAAWRKCTRARYICGRCADSAAISSPARFLCEMAHC